MPFKSDLKSLVWYVPSVWAEKGYDGARRRSTEFNDLIDKMIANGDTPLCVGIESGTATGWPFTDWVEELILREQGIDYYNQWVDHEVPFNDQPVVDAFNEVAGPTAIGPSDGAVFAVGGSIAATAFGDNAEPLVEGKCMMHRQANFFGAFFPKGTRVRRRPGPGQHVLLPVRRAVTRSWSAASSAGAFRDAPEVWKVMQYLGSAEYANARQAAQSDASRRRPLRLPHRQHEGRHDATGHRSSRASSRRCQTANPAAFDGSDQMPAEVGSGTFWTEGTSFVNGDEDAKAAADNIEASWPS